MEKQLPPIIALFITSIISIVIYLEKFKARIVQLKYRLFFNPLGTTIQNEFWGNIEVRYKDRKSNHLSFVTVDLSNDSNIDLENVNVDVWVDQDSQILGHNGYYDKIGNSILLEKGYYSYFTEVLQRSDEDIQQSEIYVDHVTPTQLTSEINWVLTNKKFNLPIFNRHTSIRLNLLIENFKGLTPQLKVSVLHKSVKLVTEQDKSEEEKKLGINMIIWGLISFIFGAYITQNKFPESTTPIIIVGILGVLYLVFGYFIYRIIKFIKYLLA